MKTPAVEFQSVNFAFDGPNVVEDASFSIEPGDFVSIVGPNGGGKTTLLKLMLGLLKPKSGTVRLFGEFPRTSCPRVGYTPQFLTVDFSFPISVLDVVLMGRLRTGFSLRRLWYSGEDRQAALGALQILRLDDCADRPFRSLSGGQRQRVLIARAVCGEPEILLLDEPTNNIDQDSERILSDILVELHEKMTVVMVSHDTGFVTGAVRHVICVNRKVAVHPASEIDEHTFHDLYGRPDLKVVLHDHV